MVGILATLVWRGKRNAVRAARFVGLMCDEATDVSTKGKLLVYYRYADLLGKLAVVFAGVEDLSCGLDAPAITASVLHRLLIDGITPSNIFCLTTDGASVVLGHANGLANRMLNLNAVCVAIHCFCHRESLAAKYAAELIPYIGQVFFPYTELLFRFFDFSTKHTQCLHQMVNS